MRDLFQSFTIYTKFLGKAGFVEMLRDTLWTVLLKGCAYTCYRATRDKKERKEKWEKESADGVKK